MIVLTHWIDKYFFTPIEIEGCVSWRKIEDIVCINKWCRRFCKEFDAKFFIYDGHCPKNVKLIKNNAYIKMNLSYYLEVDEILNPKFYINIYPWEIIENKYVFMIPYKYEEIYLGINYMFENQNLFQTQNYRLNYHSEFLSSEYLYNEYAKEETLISKQRNNYIKFDKYDYEKIGLIFDVEENNDLDYQKYNQYTLKKTQLSKIIQMYFHGFLVIECAKPFKSEFMNFRFIMDDTFKFCSVKDLGLLKEKIEVLYE